MSPTRAKVGDTVRISVQGFQVGSPGVSAWGAKTVVVFLVPFECMCMIFVFRVFSIYNQGHVLLNAAMCIALMFQPRVL